MPEMISIGEMHNYTDKYDWFVRLKSTCGSKFYDGGRFPQNGAYGTASGAWHIQYGKAGTVGQNRVKKSYADVVTALNKKIASGKYTPLEPITPVTKSGFSQSYKLTIYKSIDPRTLISTIKDIRQVHADFKLDDSLRFCKSVAEQLRDIGKAQVTRYCEMSVENLNWIAERYERLGFAFESVAVPQERQVDLSQYEMFSQVAYVRWSEESHGTGMCWRGYDSQHRKLMVVPAKLIPKSP